MQRIKSTTAHKEGANVQGDCATPEQLLNGEGAAKDKGLFLHSTLSVLSTLSPCVQHNRRPLALCETGRNVGSVGRICKCPLKVYLVSLVCAFPSSCAQGQVAPDKPGGGKSETSNCARSSDVRTGPSFLLFSNSSFPSPLLSAVDLCPKEPTVFVWERYSKYSKYANTGVVCRPGLQVSSFLG